MLQDFKAFIMRGNVVDLAVGVAIGAAFATVVDSFTDGFITPLLGMLGGGANLDTYTFAVGESVFGYGMVIAEFINFVLVAAVLFFVVIVPVNKMSARVRRGEVVDAAPPMRACPECLSEIPAAATRCAHCTSQLVASR